MQLVNCEVRLGGSQLHTVPKANVTPAEILVLRFLHGDDAVQNIRPGKVDKTIRHETEYDRLASIYGGSQFKSEPGEESKAVMPTLFPGAMKKLPTTLQEIGLGHLLSPAAKAAAKAADAAIVPDLEDAPEPEPLATEADVFTPVEEDEDA